MGQPTPAPLTGWGQCLDCWIGGVIEGWWSPPAGPLGMGADSQPPGHIGPPLTPLPQPAAPAPQP